MSELPLFPGFPESVEVSPRPPVVETELRLSRPVRNQVEMVMRDLDSSLDPEHPVRAVWALVERIGPFAALRARTRRLGRP